MNRQLNCRELEAGEFPRPKETLLFRVLRTKNVLEASEPTEGKQRRVRAAAITQQGPPNALECTIGGVAEIIPL